MGKRTLHTHFYELGVWIEGVNWKKINSEKDEKIWAVIFFPHSVLARPSQESARCTGIRARHLWGWFSVNFWSCAD